MNQKTVSLSIRWDMIPFLIKALTLTFGAGFACKYKWICKDTRLVKLLNKKFFSYKEKIPPILRSLEGGKTEKSLHGDLQQPNLL